MAKNRTHKWGVDIFPTLTELKIAEDLGMSPDEYCKALNDQEEYERQIDDETAAKSEE